MSRSRLCVCVLCAVVGAALAVGIFWGLATPAAQAQAPKGPVSFINDIAPIFKENCFACHEPKKRKGKLDMTTYEKLRKGGASADPVVPGKPEESYLYELITTTSARRMPPKDSGEPLSKEKIALIERWLKEGGKLDGGLQANADLVKELRLRWKPPTPSNVYKYPAIINSLIFTPDNKQVVVSGHHELTVWDFNEAKLVKRIRTRAERTYAMLFLPDGKLVAAGGRPGQEGDVRVYDLNGPSKDEGGMPILDGVNDKKVMIKQLTDSDDAILCLALSKDGNQLAAGGCDRLVRVWDISGGIEKAKLSQTTENHADWVFGVAFSPDGKHLLTGSRDKTAKVWDLSAKESVVTFPGHQAPVYGVAVVPAGKQGYSIGQDRNLRSWNYVGDSKTLGRQVRSSGGHGLTILKIVQHADKPILVTCSADKSVRMWDANNGRNTRTMNGHNDHVFAVAISPDAKLIASGSYDGEVRIWNGGDGKLLKNFVASPGLSQTAAAPAK